MVAEELALRTVLATVVAVSIAAGMELAFAQPTPGGLIEIDRLIFHPV